jgi:hypothetical protein
MSTKKRAFTTKYPSPPPEPEVRDQYFEKESAIDSKKIHSKLVPFIRTRLRLSRPASILSRILMELDGRDKTMKMTQYFIKLLLHYHIVYAKHWSLVTNHLSITRKLLRVGNVVHSYHTIVDHNPLSIYDAVILCNTILNQISDDIFCFYKLDLIDGYWGLRAELLALYCWLTKSIIDIWEITKSRRIEQSNDKANDLMGKKFFENILLIKLFMDVVFCGKSLDIYLQKKKCSVIFTFLEFVTFGNLLFPRFYNHGQDSSAPLCQSSNSG